MSLPGWIEWASVAFNVGYVILAGRRNIWCWPLGIIGVVLALFVYAAERLYSDALLQVFYAVMGIYGWVVWSRSVGKPDDGILRMPLRLHVVIVGLGVAGGWVLGRFWSAYGAVFPLADGLTTSFSILATWLVARRYLENWLYWIVIDLACIVIYALRDIQAFLVLFVLYVLLAVWGWFAWREAEAHGKTGSKAAIYSD